MLNYQVIRSKRRQTLGLQVKNGQVIIRAPQLLPTDFIDQVVQQKSAWLTSKVLEQQQALTEQANKLTANKFSDGGEVYLWGQAQKIVVCYQTRIDKNSQVSHQHQQLLIAVPKRFASSEASALSAYLKKVLEAFFKKLAQQYLDHNLANFVAITGLPPAQVKVRKYRARWGSCNSRQELSFNYLLVMAPNWVFDYVIIHELCHLKHLNHSKAYWRLVAHFYPDYPKAKLWLQQHNRALVW